jgi:hypothetical protein
MKTTRIGRYLKKNPLIIAFPLLVVLVGIFLAYRLFISKPYFVYIKVKVGQGLWWAATSKPPIWYMESFKKGDRAKDLVGKTSAQILSKRYYRWYGYDQFDVYLTMLLKVGFNKKTGEYTFDRSVLSVGTPVGIQFPRVDISGTVIALSRKPFEDKLVEKTVYLTKKFAYPWEYDAIKIGDFTFDGEDKIFEVLDKDFTDTVVLSQDTFGNSGADITENNRYISVKARIKGKVTGGQFILGEDQLVVPGRNLNISTSGFVFDNYIVSKLE